MSSKLLDLAATAVRDAFPKLAAKMLKTGSFYAKSAKFNLRKGVVDYGNQMIERYGNSRSFFHRREPVPLDQFYVPLCIQIDRLGRAVEVSADILGISKHIVIVGIGGCGKSVLLRYLLLDSIRRGEYVPIFIELRDLEKSAGTIDDLMLHTVQSLGFDLDAEILLKNIEAGSFLLLFDGYDELTQERRAAVGVRIREISRSAPSTPIVITSRPDDDFNAWDSFSEYHVVNLSLPDAEKLVSLTPLHNDTKERFVSELRRSLFETHQSFLSNPLLLSIMLVTYYDSAQIPGKIGTFYSQAYEAVFQRHDAWKGGYRRERYTNLDIEEFAKFFSAFSMISYDKEKFSFGYADAIAFAKTATKITGQNEVAESLIRESIQSACLLTEDGLDIAYTHRSFQEYFAARFIVNSPQGIRKQLLERAANRIRFDEVISLAHEMNPDVVERELLLPVLKAFFDSLSIHGPDISRDSHVEFLRRFYSDIGWMLDDEGDEGIAFTVKSPRDVHYDIAGFVSRLYRANKLHSLECAPENLDAIYRRLVPNEREEWLSTDGFKAGGELEEVLFRYGTWFGPPYLTHLWDQFARMNERSLELDQSISIFLSS